MAGHSQFKNIMYRKGAQDAKRAKMFSKLARELQVAARAGMPDPEMNARLRAAIASASPASARAASAAAAACSRSASPRAAPETSIAPVSAARAFSIVELSSGSWITPSGGMRSFSVPISFTWIFIYCLVLTYEAW